MASSMQKIIPRKSDRSEEPPKLSKADAKKNESAVLAQIGYNNLTDVSGHVKAPPPVRQTSLYISAWKIKELASAAQLLCNPPMKIDFDNEIEMRKTYAIVVEVFRYKTSLNEALNKSGYFEIHPEDIDNHYLLWLFIMELARRKWIANDKKKEEALEQLLGGPNSIPARIEKRVWEHRVHFAAAIAKIRIIHRALFMEELLPEHLRESHCNSEKCRETVTGWVNKHKIKKLPDFIAQLTGFGYSYSSSRELCALEYRFDRVCPRFITIRPPAKQSGKQNDIFKNGTIVIQEREFCEGASMLCRILHAQKIFGNIVQTHAINPRSTAYLAAQISELEIGPFNPNNSEIFRKLIVFGAGKDCTTFVNRLKYLGVDAIEAREDIENLAAVVVWRKGLMEVKEEAFEVAVAALACPPCSHSAVTDPVDLVCSRGGDLELLEALTESGSDCSAKIEAILAGQKKTLEFLMSKPEIQVILYETHSAHAAENDEMVTHVINRSNTKARLHYLRNEEPSKHCDLNPAKSKHSAMIKPLPIITEQLSVSKTNFSCIMSKQETTELSDVVSKATININKLDDIKSNVKMDASINELHVDQNLEVKQNTGTISRCTIKDLIKLEIMHEADVDENLISKVEIPKTDLFQKIKLPKLGNGLDIDYILHRDGCYLALIQRQEIVHMDAKYMISVAKERGVFGRESYQVPSTNLPKQNLKKPKKNFRRVYQISRITAPTVASSRRKCGLPPIEQMEPVTDCLRNERYSDFASRQLKESCTCDKRHKPFTIDWERKVKLPVGVCRKVFPLKIHDVELKILSQ